MCVCVYYMSEAKSWSDTPPCAEHGGQDMVAVFTPEVGQKGRLPVIGSLVTRETSRGACPSPAPLIRTIPSWGLGQVRRKVSHVGRVEVKQALVGQGI